MTRTRWLGVALLAGSLVCLLIAIGFGVAASRDLMAKTVAVPAALGFAVASEAMFWAGGAALGLSFFKKRAGWLEKLLNRSKGQGASQ